MKTTHTLRRGAALALAGATAAVMTIGAPAQAGEPRYVDSCDLAKTVTELQDYGSNLGTNIIVFSTGSEESSHFDGIVRQGEIKEKGCEEVAGVKTFRWVEFTGGGEFVRKGDGGYRNWAFAGVFDRDDNHVTFHPR